MYHSINFIQHNGEYNASGHVVNNVDNGLRTEWRDPKQNGLTCGDHNKQDFGS